MVLKDVSALRTSLLELSLIQIDKINVSYALELLLLLLLDLPFQL